MGELIKKSISRLIDLKDLTGPQMEAAMGEIMDGVATQAQIGAFITALRMKKETPEEISAAARAIRRRRVPIGTGGKEVVDLCGTGGDGHGTFNISTTAAFVVAGAGVAVAKHGNRAVSSSTGSADLLKALGVNIEATPDKVEECIRKIDIGFLFAPSLHPAMKRVAGPRRETGIRSIFNVLGPLCNPAGAKAQLIGVYQGELVETVAHALKNLGLERAFVVHGLDGLDEITLTDKTLVAELIDGEVKSYEISPEDFGLARCEPGDLTGGDAERNAELTMSIFRGEKGPRRDITILNAAAAIAVGGGAGDIRKGVARAEEAIDTGKALEKLELLKRLTN